MKKAKDSKPTNYKKDIPRVSEIVSFYYPFEGTDKERWFRSWLLSHKGTYEAYMEEASRWGTYVHKKLEEYLKGMTQKNYKKEYASIVNQGKILLDSLWERNWETEVYFNEGRYQGTTDLIDRTNFKVGDFKTWGLAKRRFGIPENEESYRVPKEKLTKATLQLSLYAYGIDRENYDKYEIGVLRLNWSMWCYMPLVLIPKAELEIIIENFLDNYNTY